MDRAQLAQGLPETLRCAGAAGLRQVSDDVTREAQQRCKKDDEQSASTAPASALDEPGYGYGV